MGKSKIFADDLSLEFKEFLLKNIITNVGVILLFGFGFYALTLVVNLLAATEKVVDHEFSYIKRTADKHWNDKNFSEAARYYKQVFESDPHNSNAQFAYAHCLFVEIQNSINERTQTNNESDSIEIDDGLQSLMNEAIDAFQLSTATPQFRHMALRNLAMLHGFLGNNETAIDFLRQAIQRGWKPDVRGTRNWFAQFNAEDLLDHPDIVELIGTTPSRYSPRRINRKPNR